MTRLPARQDALHLCSAGDGDVDASGARTFACVLAASAPVYARVHVRMCLLASAACVRACALVRRLLMRHKTTKTLHRDPDTQAGHQVLKQKEPRLGLVASIEDLGGEDGCRCEDGG